MKLTLKYFGKIIKESHLENGKEYLVGRHKECDFILQEEAGLSRNHVKIYQSLETGNWIVESLSEWGGLYLEGEEVDGVELEDSSTLTLKNYTLEFVKENDSLEQQEQQEEKPQENQNLVQELKPSLKEEEKSFEGNTKVFDNSNLIYSLYIYIDGEISDHVSLNEGQEWVLGRSEDCDISIDYSVLTRKHLQILKTEGFFYIKDLGSSNKTFLNGKELEPQKAMLLKANDEISVSDLKMVFEVRNKNFEKMMSGLPALSEEDSGDRESLPGIVASKVVLEEASEEEETQNKKLGRFKIERLVFLIVPVAVAIGFGLYFYYDAEEKRRKKTLEERLQEKEHKDKLEVLYKDALKNQEEKRYQLCIDQIRELHSMSAGSYMESNQIMFQCKNALEKEKHKEDYLAREEAKKQTEETIKKIVEECKKQFEEGSIQTEEALNACAKDMQELDPANHDISAIRMEIQERERLKLFDKEKREAYLALIGRKKTLYNKAKKKKDQSPLKKAPEVIKSYDVFLKAAKNFSPLKELYKQAETEKNELQTKYDRELERRYKACEDLISKKELKSAYYNCQTVLEFKKEDKKAKNYMKQAKLELEKSFKSIYEQSMLDESFSRIEKAKKLWAEILEKDIKEGYYYKKAVFHMKKYK